MEAVNGAFSSYMHRLATESAVDDNILGVNEPMSSIQGQVAIWPESCH